MKKIVFATLPLKNDMKKRTYPVDGNALIEVNEPIYYAVNSALANTMKADDEIKVLLLETKGGENAGKENAKLFEEELNHFNKVGAHITYKTLPSAFDMSKTNFQFMFKAILKELDHDAEIYVDITYGPKPLAFLLFTVCQFAEKFFDCSIGIIVYSKVEFKKGEIVDGSEIIYDITPLYLMQNFTNMIETSSSEQAIKTIDALFED